MRQNKYGEPINKDGQLLLGHHTLKLLEGLYRAPGCSILSKKQWAQQSGSHTVCIDRIPSTMYTYKKMGSAHVCTLTKRGRKVAEGKIPTWIIGKGLYQPPKSSR